MFGHRKTRQPQPGAMSYAAFPLQSLPLFDMKGYMQFEVLSPLREYQPPQVWALQGWTTAGIGGIQTGQAFFQALANNPAGNG